MLSSTAVKEGNPGWEPGLGQIASTAGILGKGEADRFNRCRLRPNESELFMTLKMNRRRFAGLSVAAAASVWARPALGENREAAEFVNPLIGASTSQKLGEGKTFPGATTPFGLVQLGPDTLTGGDNAPGYSYEHTTIEGFSYTRMSGVGWYGDFGNLMTMPMVGEFKAACGRPDHP